MLQRYLLTRAPNGKLPEAPGVVIWFVASTLHASCHCVTMAGTNADENRSH
jgi:hypothetical protein